MDLSNQNWGKICLCLFLLITGVCLVTNIRIAAGELLQGVCAIAAAILLFLESKG